jgi:hypothetical protein
VECPMADAGSSSRSHNSVTEPTYLLTQVSVNKQDIAVLTELGRIEGQRGTRGGGRGERDDASIDDHVPPRNMITGGKM